MSTLFWLLHHLEANRKHPTQFSLILHRYEVPGCNCEWNTEWGNDKAQLHPYPGSTSGNAFLLQFLKKKSFWRSCVFMQKGNCCCVFFIPFIERFNCSIFMQVLQCFPTIYLKVHVFSFKSKYPNQIPHFSC